MHHHIALLVTTSSSERASLCSLPFPLLPLFNSQYQSFLRRTLREIDFQISSTPGGIICLSVARPTEGLFDLDGGLPAEGLGYGRRVYIAGAHIPGVGRERGVQRRAAEPVHRRRHQRVRPHGRVLWASVQHHRLQLLLQHPVEPAQCAAEHDQQCRARAHEVRRSGTEAPQQTVRKCPYSVKEESPCGLISLHANVDGKLE